MLLTCYVLGLQDTFVHKPETKETTSAETCRCLGRFRSTTVCHSCSSDMCGTIVQCSYSWLINRPYVTEWMRKTFFFPIVVNRIRTLFGIVEWRLFVSMTTASNSRMSKNNSFTNVTNFWFLCAGGWWWLFETWKSFVTSYFAEILFEEWQ